MKALSQISIRRPKKTTFTIYHSWIWWVRQKWAWKGNFFEKQVMTYRCGLHPSDVGEVACFLIIHFEWKGSLIIKAKPLFLLITADQKNIKPHSHFPKKIVLFVSMKVLYKWWKIVKTLFVLKIFQFLSWLFGHVLPNISRSKDNQTMNFGQLKKYSMRNFFFKN